MCSASERFDAKLQSFTINGMNEIHKAIATAINFEDISTRAINGAIIKLSSKQFDEDNKDKESSADQIRQPSVAPKVPNSSKPSAPTAFGNKKRSIVELPSHR
jgi:hypothetical protein